MCERGKWSVRMAVMSAARRSIGPGKHRGQTLTCDVKIIVRSEATVKGPTNNDEESKMVMPSAAMRSDNLMNGAKCVRSAKWSADLKYNRIANVRSARWNGSGKWDRIANAPRNRSSGHRTLSEQSGVQRRGKSSPDHPPGMKVAAVKGLPEVKADAVKIFNLDMLGRLP